MFNHAYRQLVVEEEYVTTVLGVVNRHQGAFTNANKRVGSLGWASDPGKWYVGFYASAKEWGRIATDLSKIGEIKVDVGPGGTTNLYFERN